MFLEPAAAYAEAQELPRETGETLPVSPRTLWKRMGERGLLASRDASRQRYTVRRRLGGHDRQEVLHFRADTLLTLYATVPTVPSVLGPRKTSAKRGQRLGTVAGTVAPGAAPTVPTTVPRKRRESPAEMARWGRSGRSDTGERPPGQENSIPPGTRRRGAI